MSTIRYLEEVPHIVRYGMQDDKKKESSMTFWRSGVGFEVEVAHEDVRGTPFSKKWLEYLKEPNHFDPPLGHNEWVRRWETLCDCILTQCMPMLVELAPSSRGWVTLNDYLHTPSYRLKMVTSDATKDAMSEIIDGPKDMPSYEHWPTAAANIKHLPIDAPRLHAKELNSPDQGLDWRCPPKKVQALDGRVFAFETCQKTAKYMDDDVGTLVNTSMDIISVYSRLYKKTPDNTRISRMEGIVVTEPSLDIKDSSPSADYNEDPRANHQDQERTDEVLVAGILLAYLHNAKTLAEALKSEGKKPTTEQRDKWKKQIAESITFLHGLSITIGGHTGKNAWFYINQHTVMIAGDRGGKDSDAWLILGAGCTSHEPERLNGSSDAQARFDEERAMDLEGVEKTFDF